MALGSLANPGWSRKLWPNEGELIVRHLMRLSPEDRGARFMAAAGEAQVRAHVERRFPRCETVIGWFAGGILRAVAEIAVNGKTAEAALTVEAPWRRRGIAAALLARAVRQAQMAGARELVLYTAASNRPLLALARKAGARMRQEGAEVIATLDIGPLQPQPLWEELAEEQHGQAAHATAMLCPVATAAWALMLDRPRPTTS